MEDIGVIEQLVASMDDAIELLEKADAKHDAVEVNRLKIFIIDLHKKIALAMGVKNVR